MVNVDCGTEWIVYNDNSDVFSTDATSNSLTVSAGQNLVKNKRTGTIYLMTRWYRIIFATITVTQDAYGSPEITVGAKECHFPAVGELSTEIAVEANGEWTAECDANWLTIGKTEAGIILTAAQNPETTERTAEVVLTCADDYNSASKTVKVTQDALAYINLGAEELTFYAYEYTTTVNVESNFDWACTCNSDWLSVEKDDNHLAVTYTTNESASDREAVLTVIAGDGAENVAEAELKVTQKWYDTEKSLILEYNLSSSGQTVKLPLSSVIYALINWGDGELETVSSEFPSHKYSTSGTYTVTVNGEVEHIQSYDSSSISGASYLTAVVQWGDLGLTDMSRGFRGCSKLASLPEGNVSFSNVTSFAYCFCNCSSLKGIPDGMFDQCSNVTSFSYCFFGCSSLKGIPDGIFDHCSSVIEFHSAFQSCTSLTTVPENLFSGCTLVTDFASVFCYCTALMTVPENLFSGFVAVTDFSYAFCDCTSLTTIPENLFSGCIAVTDFTSVFNSCTSLTTVSENVFFDCTSVTSFHSAFNTCTSLTGVPENIFSSCTLVTDFYLCFWLCKKMGGESPYSEITVDGETVKVHLYEREDYPDYFSAPTDYRACFGSCSSLSDYKNMPWEWISIS